MSSMTVVRQIAASVDTVFEVVSTPEGIAPWWGPDAGPVVLAEFDARVGGHFRVRFRMLNGAELECSGEVLELVQPVRLVTTWCWLGNEGEAPSRIEISLKATGSGCEMVFTWFQRQGISDDVFASDSEWVQSDLLRMKAYIEGR